jgi:hypothetical protein
VIERLRRGIENLVTNTVLVGQESGKIEDTGEP